MSKDSKQSLNGQQLGCYKIVSMLGAGGMGDVYQAHDTKLGRNVALKVLPEAFARDPERLARFQREARSGAALNHPHIVTIFSVEEVEDMNITTRGAMRRASVRARRRCAKKNRSTVIRLA